MKIISKSSFWLAILLIFSWLSLLVDVTGSREFYNASGQMGRTTAIIDDLNKTLGLNTSLNIDLIEKRSESSKTYRNFNGSLTMETYGSPIHFKENYANADEFWKDIDETHTVEYPTYVMYDRMPTIVRMFKDQTGYEIESRKTGHKFSVLLQDIDGREVTLEENQKYASQLVDKAKAAESQAVKFDYEISANGVRLWKTITGPNAPKNFTWKVTEMGQGDDLKFRENPEAFEVVNGEEQPDKQVQIGTKKSDVSSQTSVDSTNDQRLTTNFLWTETAPTTNLKIDTDVNYNSGAGDGFVHSAGEGMSGWDDAHYATDGDYSNAFAETAAADDSWGGDLGYGGTGEASIRRAFLPFDTSALPDDLVSIDSVELNVYVTISLGGDVVVVQTSQASTSSLSMADFDQCGDSINDPNIGGTLASGDITTNSYNGIPLDTVLDWFSVDGYTKLGLRTVEDTSSSIPSPGESGITFATSEDTSGTKDPYLAITYTPAEGEEGESGSEDTTGNVNLSGTVLSFLTLSFTSGANISFGNITPGTDACNVSGTVASVTTNAANGYGLLLSDVAGTNSAMKHTDTTTYIPDMVSATLAAPAQWATGATTGVGVSLWSGSSALDAQWATGTTACSYVNKFGAVPAAATTGHTVTGYHETADTSNWGWKVNVLTSQKTGMYNGNVLFTGVPVLN